MLILKYISPLVSILFFLNSCTTFKNFKPYDERKAINENNIQLLNNTYKNTSDTSKASTVNLWYQFFLFTNLKQPEQYQVKLKFINHKKAEVYLLEYGEIIKSRKIRGKLKDGCFYINRKLMIIPFFPLIWGYGNSKTRICLSNDEQQLIVDVASVHIAFAVVAGSSGKSVERYYFPVVKE